MERSYPSFICKNNWEGVTCCTVVLTLLFVKGDRGKNLFSEVHKHLDNLGFDKPSLKQWAKATQSNMCTS